jgi:hypothetical protein
LEAKEGGNEDQRNVAEDQEGEEENKEKQKWENRLSVAT